MKVEIYSDIACPWCYIGKARFEKALEEFEEAESVEIVFRPYQLDPGAPRKGVPMLAYLERRFGPSARGMADRVIQEARREGLEMDYDRGIAANTLTAHRLLHLAEREKGPEMQRTLAERLFEAHFASGLDVGDVDVLADVAAKAGMDRRRVHEELAGTTALREVREEIEQARNLGITAVPTFVFEGRYAVQGAQPVETFRKVLEEVARELTETESVSG